MRHPVAISGGEALLDSGWIYIDTEKTCAIHGRRQRLRTAHATESATDDELAFERSAEVFLRGRGERLERTLHNSLAADIDPGASRHLAVHGQAETFQPIEFRVIRPMADQI